MKEPPNAGPEDWFFDEHQQQWLRRSGVAHWQTVLAERRANRDPQARAETLRRLGMDPNRPVCQVFRSSRPSGYSEGMRRPEVELSDAAASYVERHPAVIEKLAGGIPAARGDQELRARIRGRIRARLQETRTPEAVAAAAVAGDAWLAKYGLTRAQAQ